MSVALTDAGAALIAQLQAASQPLTIDTMVFANVPDQDFTVPIDTAAGIPAGVVHEAGIPPEYRAFVNPNQIVYSALLGSTVGPFSFNWQGLYCSEHDTLVAVATFPPLEKRAYDPNTNTPGNNLTRNFMLVFTGAQELTQITVEAAVWQLDFTVRLKGIDERERLAMRDLCGRAVFLDDGWLLTNNAGAYHFEAGHGFVEGIRAALSEPLPVAPSITPCDVWLDVSLQPQGSDVVTVVTPVFLAPGASNPDYSEAAPYHTPHYCVRVASVAANGAVTDLRPNRLAITHEHIGAAAQTDLDAHEARTDNPHGVTKAQVGLGNLPNAKSDAVNLDSTTTLASSRAVRIVRDAQLGTQGEVDALEALIAGYEGVGQLGPAKLLGGNVNMDEVVEGGFYWCYASGQVNGPNLGAGLLQVGGSSGSYKTQLFISVYGRTAVRAMDSGEWRTWIVLAGGGHGDSATVGGLAPSAFAAAAHGHAITHVTGLQAALDGLLPLAGGTLSGLLTAEDGVYPHIPPGASIDGNTPASGYPRGLSYWTVLQDHPNWPESGLAAAWTFRGQFDTRSFQLYVRANIDRIYWRGCNSDSSWRDWIRLPASGDVVQNVDIRTTPGSAVMAEDNTLKQAGKGISGSGQNVWTKLKSYYCGMPGVYRVTYNGHRYGDGGEPRVQIRTSDGYMGTVRYPGSSWATYEEDVTVNAFGATIEVWGLSDSQYDSRLCETQLFRISVGRWALRTGIVLH